MLLRHTHITNGQVGCAVDVLLVCSYNSIIKKVNVIVAIGSNKKQIVRVVMSDTRRQMLGCLLFVGYYNYVA